MAKKTHQTHFTVPKIPWHTEVRTFGVATDIRSADNIQSPCPPRDSLPSTLFLVDEGRCTYCGSDGVYGYAAKIYCSTCWASEEA